MRCYSLLTLIRRVRMPEMSGETYCTVLHRHVDVLNHAHCVRRRSLARRNTET
jgi:hypothetical protein